MRVQAKSRSNAVDFLVINKYYFSAKDDKDTVLLVLEDWINNKGEQVNEEGELISELRKVEFKNFKFNQNMNKKLAQASKDMKKEELLKWAEEILLIEVFETPETLQMSQPRNFAGTSNIFE